MARCFRLLKDLPYVPAGLYFKMDVSERNIYLSISTTEYFMKRQTNSHFQFYSIPWDQSLLNVWFEETEAVPDQGDASTHFHGKNWYWTKPKFYWENGDFFYCDRKTKRINRDQIPIKMDEDDKNNFRIDVVEDSPAGCYDVYEVNGIYYVSGKTIAGDLYLQVL
jgi:hypothetical protein